MQRLLALLFILPALPVLAQGVPFTSGHRRFQDRGAKIGPRIIALRCDQTALSFEFPGVADRRIGAGKE